MSKKELSKYLHLMQDIASTHRKRTAEAVRQYHADVGGLDLYSDAEQIRRKTAAAESAKAEFAEAAKEYQTRIKAVAGLAAGQLAAMSTDRPSEQFIQVFELYDRLHITPDKSDIDSLIKLSGGNFMAMRAVTGLADRAGYDVSGTMDRGAAADLIARVAEWEPMPGEGYESLYSLTGVNSETQTYRRHIDSTMLAQLSALAKAVDGIGEPPTITSRQPVTQAAQMGRAKSETMKAAAETVAAYTV